MTTANIDSRTVMNAIWRLHDRARRWPTVAEIADYLEVDEKIVRPLLRELKSARLYRDRQRDNRRVWMPWDEAR